MTEILLGHGMTRRRSLVLGLAGLLGLARVATAQNSSKPGVVSESELARLLAENAALKAQLQAKLTPEQRRCRRELRKQLRAWERS